MLIPADEILSLMSYYIWPFLRISSMLLAAPIIGTKIVPSQPKIALAIFMTILITPLISDYDYIEPFSLEGLIVAIEQVIIGLSLGFSIRLVFSVLETGGHLIGQTMGLGFAQMIDPSNGVSVPAVSQFYIILATLLFLLMNGHILMLEVLVESFTFMPAGLGFFEKLNLWYMIDWSTWIFKGAVIMSIPAVASLLLVQISFGVMMRAAPQLNIFTIGFPISLVLGFVFIYASLPLFVNQFELLLSIALRASLLMVGGE